MREPYYGILLSSMRREPSTQFSTMAVGRNGNVFQLYYNPDFVNRLTVDAVCQCLKHECLHVAFAHFSIWDDNGMYVGPDEKYLRNIAADMECNSYLERSVIPEDLNLVWAEDHGFAKSLGTKEYYRRLKQEMEQQEQEEEKQQEQEANASNPEQDCNGGSGETGENDENKQQSNSSSDSDSDAESDDSDEDETGISITPVKAKPVKSASSKFLEQFKEFDDHTLWPDDMSDSEREQLQEDIDTMLAFAADEIEKAQGTIPGELVGRIEKIRQKPRPATDWKRYFRRYLGNEFSELLRKSKKRESKRFPDAAGNRHKRKSHILIGIDTSGSVSMPEYREFFGQILTLTKSASFHVVECDACIQHEYDFKRFPNEQLHGGGGTDFQPVVDLFLKNRKNYDALVYFTDGWCNIPHNTPKETLWVVSSQGDHNKAKYKVNGASVVFIPPQNESRSR